MQAGIENAVQEANWLVKFAHGDLDDIVRRRIGGEPLQYLLGEWEFYGYPFKVGKGVLIPRPETELLVDIVKENSTHAGTVYDLCAGSGCVGISIAKETALDIIAVEKSPEALGYLRQNVKLNDVGHQINVVNGDVLDDELIKTLAQQPGCSIVINAPYLSKCEMQYLQREVTHEPKMALFGGDDGLDFYRSFFSKWERVLKQSSIVACEVGDGQAGAVLQMMEDTGLAGEIRKDYGGIARVVFAVSGVHS